MFQPPVMVASRQPPQTGRKGYISTDQDSGTVGVARHGWPPLASTHPIAFKVWATENEVQGRGLRQELVEPRSGSDSESGDGPVQLDHIDVY
jgi:hypothetical protein